MGRRARGVVVLGALVAVAATEEIGVAVGAVVAVAKKVIIAIK